MPRLYAANGRSGHEDVRIGRHFAPWCTCHATERLHADKTNVRRVADGVVWHINDVVSVHRSRCAVLRLVAVVKARRLLPGNDVMRFRNSRRDVIGRTVEFDDDVAAVAGRFAEYQLTLRTTPGGALFEATVRQEGNSSTEVAFVSRINAYSLYRFPFAQEVLLLRLSVTVTERIIKFK